MSGGGKAGVGHFGPRKDLKAKPRATVLPPPDPRLAAFMDKLADLLVADLLRKPSDRR